MLGNLGPLEIALVAGAAFFLLGGSRASKYLKSFLKTRKLLNKNLVEAGKDLLLENDKQDPA